VKSSIHCIAIGTLLIASAFSASAQEGLRGHWRGAVDTPTDSLAMELDLDQVKGVWIGAVSIPAQKVSGIPLDGITFLNGKFSFRMKGGPGDPTFTGTLSADGNKMSGEFKQGGGTLPFQFTRAGAPKIEAPKDSPALPKEFLGNWEGTLDVGQPLLLILKMSNDPTGAKALLISIDQDNAEISVSGVERKDTKLTLSLNMIGGRYVAEINKDGSELSGTWTQGGTDLPLKFKKTPAK